MELMELNNLMEMLDLVVWNNTNHGIGGSDEATGIEFIESKGGIDGINVTGIDGMERRKEC